nr:MAG TPA: hypothetical protein [Siphoviridae sp. ctJZ725]
MSQIDTQLRHKKAQKSPYWTHQRSVRYGLFLF